jgi:hypothetical protein
MTKMGLIAILLAIAAIILVLVVTPGMRDASYIVRAYVITAVILAGYVWSLARRVDQAEKARTERESVQ